MCLQNIWPFNNRMLGMAGYYGLIFFLWTVTIVLWRCTMQPRDVSYHENKMDNESNCDTAVKPYWLYKHDIIWHHNCIFKIFNNLLSVHSFCSPHTVLWRGKCTWCKFYQLLFYLSECNYYPPAPTSPLRICCIIKGVETIVKILFSQTTREEVGLGSELYLTLNTSSHATSQYRENH